MGWARVGRISRSLELTVLGGGLGCVIMAIALAGGR